MPSRAELYLVVPPVWELSFQGLGVPALAAWMKRQGHEVVGKADLNIAFHHYLTGAAKLEPEFYREQWAQLQENPVYRERYVPRMDSYYTRIDLPFGHAQLVSNNYSRIPSFLDDRRFNVALRYFEESKVVDGIADTSPNRKRLVGLSLESENQLLALVTLSRLLKQRNPELLIVVGGPWLTAMLPVLRWERLLMQDIDFLIPNKGEIPLDGLLRAIAQTDGMPQSSPGVLVKRRDGSFADAPCCDNRVRGGDLPRPELFPLAWYARPSVVPYESERGCYWGKCKFCHHILHYTHTFDSKPIEKVMADLRAYRQEEDFEVVAFVDAAIPPRRIREIAEAFLAEGWNKRWAGFSKVERHFTREIFEVAARSGLDVLSFGVETGSPRLAKYIGKPIDLEMAYRVLRDCADAGIYTTAGIMNGLPSETFEDLHQMWSFLDRIKSFTYLHPHLFKFELGSEFFENAASYDLEIVETPVESRLSPYRDFVDRSGGNTRDRIRDDNVNQLWWRRNMNRTLDWKSRGEKFCKGVQFIADH